LVELFLDLGGVHLLGYKNIKLINISNKALNYLMQDGNGDSVVLIYYWMDDQYDICVWFDFNV